MLSPQDQPLHKGIVGATIGIGLGLGQWILIRHLIHDSRYWIPLTFLALALAGAAMGEGTTEALAQRGLASSTVGFALGGSLGVFQWPVFRKQFNHAILWIPANIAGLGLGWWAWWVMGFDYSDPRGTMFAILIPALFVLVTGFTLDWLLKHPNNNCRK